MSLSRMETCFNGKPRVEVSKSVRSFRVLLSRCGQNAELCFLASCRPRSVNVAVDDLCLINHLSIANPSCGIFSLLCEPFYCRNLQQLSYYKEFNFAKFAIPLHVGSLSFHHLQRRYLFSSIMRPHKNPKFQICTTLRMRFENSKFVSNVE